MSLSPPPMLSEGGDGGLVPFAQPLEMICCTKLAFCERTLFNSVDTLKTSLGLRRLDRHRATGPWDIRPLRRSFTSTLLALRPEGPPGVSKALNWKGCAHRRVTQLPRPLSGSLGRSLPMLLMSCSHPV